MLGGCYDADDKISMTVDIVYVETEKFFELILTCDGKAYNPFDKKNPAADDLSVRILRGIAKDFSYTYSDGLNRIKLIC